MSNEQMTGPSDIGAIESGEWLTAEQFAGMEGMPGTAKGARLRLEKLTVLHRKSAANARVGRDFCTISARQGWR